MAKEMSPERATELRGLASAASAKRARLISRPGALSENEQAQLVEFTLDLVRIRIEQGQRQTAEELVASTISKLGSQAASVYQERLSKALKKR